MARFYGMIGYIETPVNETDPGKWEETVKEVPYFGDVLTNSRRIEAGDGVNDNIEINNQISIVADQYAYDHFFAIRYICWMGARWKVKNVTVQRPRLILSIGGVYNGRVPEDSLT